MHIQIDCPARRAVVVYLALPDRRIDYRPLRIVAAGEHDVSVGVTYGTARHMPSGDVEGSPRQDGLAVIRPAVPVPVHRASELELRYGHEAAARGRPALARR